MQTNLQAPEKRDLTDGQTLDVHSIFYTIQGEGPFSGTPAVFIRLAGCNLVCPKCDTEYTNGRQTMPIAAIFNKVLSVSEKNARGLVVITGGEPFRQYLTPLIKMLLAFGFFVQIETNGTLSIPKDLNYLIELNLAHGACVYIVVSPKSTGVHATIEKYACAYKYVLSHGHVDPDDGLPTDVLGHPCRERVSRPRPGAPIYIQPADHQEDIANKLNVNECIRSCIKFGYTLQLQTHKLLKVP